VFVIIVVVSRMCRCGLFCNCWLIGWRFWFVYVMFGLEIIEVVIFCVNIDDGSGDCEVDEGWLVCDNVYGIVEDDVIRCDFIVNVLYYVIEDFSVCDYCGGFEDV
jgi:tRNA nucleotidyltransferase/poly(A) polymerase